MGTDRTDRRVSDGTVALVTAGIVLVLLAALPLLASTDPALAATAPAAGSPSWWVVLALVLAQAGLLLGAGRAPMTVLGGVVGLAWVGAWILPEATYSLTSVPIVVAVYLAATRRSWATMRWGAPAAVAAIGIGYVVSGLRVSTGDVPVLVLAALSQALVLVGVPLAVAAVVTTRRDIAAAQRRELQALGREREALVQAAVAEERTALARELHDIAAHHLSGIAVMASAIERQVDSAPTEAKVGIRQVRAQSRLLLDDLRRLVGLLREDSADETAVHSLVALPELVAAAGHELRMHRRDGAPDVGQGIGPLAQLTGYRMVQEAMTNAARHAPGAPCVVIVDDRDAEALVLTVRNEVSDLAPGVDPSPGGLGLRGMRERADLVGADLRHGPTLDGGWEVRLALPRARAPSRPDEEGPAS